MLVGSCGPRSATREITRYRAIVGLGRHDGLRLGRCRGCTCKGRELLGSFLCSTAFCGEHCCVFCFRACAAWQLPLPSLPTLYSPKEGGIYIPLHGVAPRVGDEQEEKRGWGYGESYVEGGCGLT